MDVIKFNVCPSDRGFGDEIQIEINGESLVTMLKEYELPMAEAEGLPGIAGAYLGLAPDIYLRPRHWYGESVFMEFPAGRVELLACGDCGFLLC